MQMEGPNQSDTNVMSSIQSFDARELLRQAIEDEHKLMQLKNE